MNYKYILSNKYFFLYEAVYPLGDLSCDRFRAAGVWTLMVA